MKKGYRHSETTCRKISKTLTGTTRPEIVCQKISNSLKGKKHSEITRKKISLTHLGKTPSLDTRKKMSISRIRRRSEKAPGWKGGISFLPYCEKFNKEFKERVRAFFDYICIECGTPQNREKLSVHHINYDKMVCCNEVRPLFVCLCRGCNTKANYNREHWEQHFTDIIEGYYQGKCFFTKEEFRAIKEVL